MDPANPQNYNRYSYVLNNPLKFTDPSGYNFQVYDSNYGCFRDENAYSGFAGWYQWGEGMDAFYGRGGHSLGSWGGVEETMYTLLEMGKSPFGISNDFGEIGIPIESQTYSMTGKTHFDKETGIFILPEFELLLRRKVVFLKINWADINFKRVNNGVGLASTAWSGIGLSIANKHWWIDAKGNVNLTSLLEKGSNGKYVKGVEGYRIGYNNAMKKASAGKVLGIIGFGINTVYNIGEISEGFDNGDGSKVVYASLNTVYNAIATFGGPVGFFIATPYLVLDATIGMDNVVKYNHDLQMERIDRINNGDYSLIWYPRIGQSVR